MKFTNILVLGLMTFAGSLILLKGRITKFFSKDSIDIEGAESTI